MGHFSVWEGPFILIFNDSEGFLSYLSRDIKTGRCQNCNSDTLKGFYSWTSWSCRFWGCRTEPPILGERKSFNLQIVFLALMLLSKPGLQALFPSILVHQSFLTGYGILVAPEGPPGFGSNLLRPPWNIPIISFFFQTRSCDYMASAVPLGCSGKLSCSAFPNPDHLFPLFPWQRRIIALYFGCLHAAFSTYFLNTHTHEFRQQPSFMGYANGVFLAPCPRIHSSCPWTSFFPFICAGFSFWYLKRGDLYSVLQASTVQTVAPPSWGWCVWLVF